MSLGHWLTNVAIGTAGLALGEVTDHLFIGMLVAFIVLFIRDSRRWRHYETRHDGDRE